MEHLVDYVLTGTLASNAPPGINRLAEQVMRYDLRKTRVVILGGGTGLSTVVGGNSQMPDWPDHPWMGVKQEFSHLSVIVCTTDDGGSTGQILKYLPMIGIGDLRKLLLSSILRENLHRTYGIDERQIMDLVKLIHAVFNHRFREQTPGFRHVANPLLAVSADLRPACPKPLADALCRLGTYISPGGAGPTISPSGNALGNLMLTSAIFMAAGGRMNVAPGVREIQSGIDHIARLIGAPAGHIHAATATPGQLKICYANGVEVYGQSKSAKARRNSPVDRVYAEFARKPVVSEAVRRSIRNADLIVYAPGSLYTSIIPILQLDPIVDEIRANRSALKVLGANSWIQEGETDISLKNQGRGFLVSELIEAYDRNVPKGIEGLFDVVLSTNLEHVPGNILRNYALEGKSPIHMDRAQVEAMGIQPVEATLFSPEYEAKTRAIYHDARKFSLAIRTLVYADRFLKRRKGYAPERRTTPKAFPGRNRKHGRPDPAFQNRSILLCDYLKSIEKALKGKKFYPAGMKDLFLELVWENRDIRPSHLKTFRGLKVIPAPKWNRSTDLDNILGYYDPADRYLKLHEDLLRDPSRLREDLLVAIGESLLGQYIEKRRWIKQNGSRCYEILLRPVAERQCFLTEAQLAAYLQLARMTSDRSDARIYRITINNDGGFLPPGLLFGLLYSWYLCGSGLTMEYEMTLLRWPLKSLIPLHVRDRIRKKALVTFFRTVVFGHPK
ncbi:MAG: YvcK family protein [Acidobacteria bacterium]|nr:YvcK family protein [Acidobacteriota bacterium]